MSSISVRVRVLESSARTPKPPQEDLSAGISVFLSQVPLTYWYQLSPGLVDLSMPLRSTPQVPSSGLPATAAVLAEAAVRAGAAIPDVPASRAAQATPLSSILLNIMRT